MRQTRHTIQLVFFVSILALVYVFKFNVEAYCPFGAIESLHTLINEGKMLCALGTGNFFVLILILFLTLLFRRIFCGYVCPIGAVSMFLRSFAADFNFKQFKVSQKLDRRLSLLKYFVLAVVLILTAATVNLVYRNISPCYLMVSINNDVKFSTYVVTVIVLTASFVISMPFCRWFCPFAAVQNIFSVLGLTRIKRDTSTCIDCQKCTKSCPMNIDVANSKTVNSPNCTSCLECIDSCPVKDEKGKKPLSWVIPGNIKISNFKAVIVSSILVCVVTTAAASMFLDLATYIYTRDITKPEATEKAVLEMQGISCSGSAKLFTYFLNRKDISAIEGYLKISTRPRTGWIDVTVTYDPSKTDKDGIIEAATEPYYDEAEQRWRPSPFEVRGFDLLDIETGSLN